MDHIFRALRYLMKWGSWSGAGVKQGNLFGEKLIVISFGSCLVKVLKWWSLEKNTLFVILCYLYWMWIWILTLKSLQSWNQFNFISFHVQDYEQNSKYSKFSMLTQGCSDDHGCMSRILSYLVFAWSTTINCDQPRSTTINHDQHGRSGGVTLYDQQESHPACGPGARLASNGGDEEWGL